MDNQQVQKPAQPLDSNRRRSRRISTSAIVLFALAGFLFWVVGEVRWSQTFRTSDQPEHTEDVHSPGVTSALQKQSTGIPSPGPRQVISRSVVPAPRTDLHSKQSQQITAKFNPSVYQQLVKTCNYWTKEARGGESVSSLQMVSCKRVRDYARSTGQSTLPVVEIRPAPTRKVEQNFVRIESASNRIRHCDYIDERIEWINSRLRAGYRVAEGERWKQELRDLKMDRYDNC